MKFTIKNEELSALNKNASPKFPKYASQIINLANQNAQGTRPNTVGQLSELFPEYEELSADITLEGWKKWYLERYPNAIDTAAYKISEQVENLKEAIKLIDKEMILEWVTDLVINKTYNGLYVQEAILAKLAEIKGTTYRLANPDEESLGIDGYVADTAYSVKPDTYKTMKRLSETIGVKMIYYTKKKTGLFVEAED